jgi:hypothetical protein
VQKTMPRDISDHVSCLVSFKSKVPKPKIIGLKFFGWNMKDS